MLTPDDITKKTFTVRHVRGYDPQEVDDFLDRVVADYDATLKRAQAAETTAATLRRTTQQIPVVPAAAPTVQMDKVAPAPPVAAAPQSVGAHAAQSDAIANVARLLEVAQQAADQQAADAKAAADKVIADAHATGSQVLADAQNQAQQIIADGTAKRNEVVGALEVQRADLQSKIDALTATHADAVAKLRSALDQLGEPAAS